MSLFKPKLAPWVHPDEVPGIMQWILGGSRLVADPSRVAKVCRDPGDDYLVALAKEQKATIVSGDGDLLALKDKGYVPVLSPREYLDASGQPGRDLLDARRRG